MTAVAFSRAMTLRKNRVMPDDLETNSSEESWGLPTETLLARGSYDMSDANLIFDNCVKAGGLFNWSLYERLLVAYMNRYFTHVRDQNVVLVNFDLGVLDNGVILRWRAAESYSDTVEATAVPMVLRCTADRLPATTDGNVSFSLDDVDWTLRRGGYPLHKLWHVATALRRVLGAVEHVLTGALQTQQTGQHRYLTVAIFDSEFAGRVDTEAYLADANRVVADAMRITAAKVTSTDSNTAA